jgi:hypothetical protein
MPLFRTQPIIDVQDIVVIVVVVALVMSWFAGLCQHSARVVCGFVSELRVAYVIRFENVSCKLPKGLRSM